MSKLNLEEIVERHKIAIERFRSMGTAALLTEQKLVIDEDREENIRYATKNALAALGACVVAFCRYQQRVGGEIPTEFLKPIELPKPKKVLRKRGKPLSIAPTNTLK